MARVDHLIRTLPPLAAAIAILGLAACGDDGDSDSASDGLEIDPIASVIDSDQPREARIEGTAVSLGELGFVLSDGTGSILVLSFATPADRVQDGETVTAIGNALELESEERLTTVREAIDSAEVEDEQLRSALDEVDAELGATYLELVNVRDEDSTPTG